MLLTSYTLNAACSSVFLKDLLTYYGKMFIDEDGGGVTDDHLFINRLARIKTIDIIAYIKL